MILSVHERPTWTKNLGLEGHATSSMPFPSSGGPIETTKKRAVLRRSLLAWFRKEARDLPWRRTRDPYAVWVSEIMLQQTRVDQGTPYFERFLAAFPDVHALATAKDDRVLKLWEGLGYYSRARNLHRAARIIAYERGGRFPATAAEWQTLPGVGRYTAGAIASISLGARVAVLDGNVMRVLSRVYNIEESTDSAATRTYLWELAESLVPANAPGDFNQALMELGARVCSPRNPLCETCPIRRCCDARKLGVQESRPVRAPKRATPQKEHVVAVIVRRGRYLLAKRPGKGLLGGLWEFPSGEVREGETHRRALRRVMSEAFGLSAVPGPHIATVNHAYSHFKVTLSVYACSIQEGEAPSPTGHLEVKWVPRTQFARYALPKANHKFLQFL
ncbi:MAG: A/G-specific adenine glycosylase [Candidatus Hydrogenedentes bacterium]|nr:A/G-specific adenine glycosylase [Candidatus Hydrogenedentota bacterium]